jgi:hypothetical protein
VPKLATEANPEPVTVTVGLEGDPAKVTEEIVGRGPLTVPVIVLAPRVREKLSPWAKLVGTDVPYADPSVNTTWVEVNEEMMTPTQVGTPEVTAPAVIPLADVSLKEKFG